MEIYIRLLKQRLESTITVRNRLYAHKNNGLLLGGVTGGEKVDQTSEIVSDDTTTTTQSEEKEVKSAEK